MALKDIFDEVKTPLIVIPEIEEYYRQIQERDIDHSDGWIHPSSITECSRRIQYSILKVPGKKGVITPRLKRIFEVGKDFHKRTQKALLERQVLLKENYEKQFQINELHLRGKCDGIITIKGITYILELKSSKKEDFVNIKKDGVSEKYILQAHCYMMGHKVNKTLFLYENKNDQDKLEIVIDENKAIINLIITKCKKIVKFTKENILCPRVCINKEEGSTRKVGCPYVDVCFSDVQVNFGAFEKREKQLDLLERWS